MPCEARQQAEETVLGGYEHVGSALVADDLVLGRLLSDLIVTSDDEDVDAYLGSFLAA